MSMTDEEYKTAVIIGRELATKSLIGVSLQPRPDLALVELQVFCLHALSSIIVTSVTDENISLEKRLDDFKTALLKECDYIASSENIMRLDLKR
jgi:hypothetical protein